MKLINYDHIPRKYTLLWDLVQKNIMIDVNRYCIEKCKTVPHTAPWVQHMIKTHGADTLFDSFSGNLTNESFGFNRLVKRATETEEYVRFVVTLPIIKRDISFACEECAGTGRREFGDECLYCNGKGTECIFEWRTAFLTTASLGLLFELLDACDASWNSHQQHISIAMMSEPGSQGSDLHGCFGLRMSTFLRSKAAEKRTMLAGAEDAMAAIYKSTGVLSKYDSGRFNARLNEGFLTLECPGDACGIQSSSHSTAQHMGIEFSCHNVDSPSQSLALLAGIASLVGHADNVFK